MTSRIFTEDSYATPPGRERVLSRLLRRSRWYYVPRFILVVLRYWRVARSGGFDTHQWHSAASRVFRMVEQAGGRFEISGLQYLREDRAPVVIVANHMSTLETLVPPAFIYPHKLPVYVIKQQLRDVPFFGAYLDDCIVVSRTNPGADFKQVMRLGTEALRAGRTVIIFPQSTRTLDIDPTTFNTLGVKLARKAGVKVLPLAIKSDFWGQGRLVKDFGPLSPHKTIHFEFAPPMTVTGTGKEQHEQIIAFIRERLQHWRAQETR